MHVHGTAQELRPTHNTDADRLALREPLAEPSVLGRPAAQRVDEEPRIEMDRAPRASLRADAARRSTLTAWAHARARAGVSPSES